jgi:hypothetical protein
MHFEIFRDRAGQWCARRQDGLVCGIFRERTDAECFARREMNAAGRGGADAAMPGRPRRNAA